MALHESPTLELKQAWQDGYLRTLCAFANTHGGVLHVGIDDSGRTVGIANSKRLLEELPNKILSKLGIIAAVQPRKRGGKDTITIAVEKAEVPISYNGKYYVRTGSTTQELNGKELARFLISKSKSNWDEYPVERSGISDINLETVETFRALARTRLPLVQKLTAPEDFLAKLNLMEGSLVKRAGILLFGRNVRKYFTSAYIRIGKFDAKNDLMSMDTIEGNLFEQIEGTMETLKSKYLVAKSRIDGLFRKDELEIPESVLREAITNAVIHREYVGAHVQIKLFPNKMIIWNEGGLPPPLTVRDLKVIHPSRPRNELLADVLFKAGLIETWGHGTLKMVEVCREQRLPEPVYAEEFGGFSVKITKDILDLHSLSDFDLNERQLRALAHIKDKGKITNQQYQQLNDVSKATATKEMTAMVDAELLERVGKRGAGTFYRPRPA